MSPLYTSCPTSIALTWEEVIYKGATVENLKANSQSGDPGRAVLLELPEKASCVFQLSRS